MKRETASRLWQVIKAYGEGRTVQYLASLGGVAEWTDVVDPLFDDDDEYRIKPEEDNEVEVAQIEEKKYRPFEDTVELMLHYAKHFKVKCPPYCEPLIWVKDEHDNRYLITGYDEKCVFLEDMWFDIKDLFYKNYTFLDGSCVGKLEE